MARQGRVLESRLSEKGQVTIPLEIRQRLGLKPRDRVCFEVEGQTVRLSPAASRIAKHFGSVAVPPEVQGWTDEQLRRAYEQGVADDVSREGV